MKLAISLSLMAATASADVLSFQNWQPRPASDLGSTATEFGIQSVCEGRYMGSDCSEKACAYGLSSSASPFLAKDGTEDNLWAAASNQYQDQYNGASRALQDGGVHTYTECSSQGICDRLTGLCSCFDGFTGLGCRRTVCPNDCSGHGVCSRNVDANSDYQVSDAPNSFFETQFWDKEKTMRCNCDRGYEGADCSLRICPHGDDVLTTCSADSNYDVQVITFTDVDGDLVSSLGSADVSVNLPLYYTLSFEDHFGGKYKTRPIALNLVDNQNAQDAQSALESLPNSAIPTVQISADFDNVDVFTLSVSFTDAATTGLQNLLTADIVASTETCLEGGQSPYTQNPVLYDTVTVSVDHQPLTEGSSYEENVPCGNRGICDSSVGKCECFEGHTGEACEIQSVFV